MQETFEQAPGAAGQWPDSGPPVEIIPTSDTTPLTASEAARALAQYRYKRDAKEERAAEAAEPAPAENQPAEQPSEAPAEEATAEAEPAEQEELPPIEPPRSWSKEDREHFNSLPREAQEVLARREQERDANFRRGQNEAAEQRKALDAERQQMEQIRQQYEQALPQLLAMYQQGQQGEFADIKTQADVEKLAREDWPRFALFQAHQMKVAAVQKEMQDHQQRQQQEFQAKQAKFHDEQNAKFMEAHPELAKPEAARKATDDVVRYLKETRGITEAELSELSKGIDARWQEILYDAARYHQAKTAVPKAVAAKPAPKVQRPGTPVERATDRDVQLTGLNRQLDDSGSIKDGLALLIAQRSGRR